MGQGSRGGHSAGAGSTGRLGRGALRSAVSEASVRALRRCGTERVKGGWGPFIGADVAHHAHLPRSGQSATTGEATATLCAQMAGPNACNLLSPGSPLPQTHPGA